MFRIHEMTIFSKVVKLLMILMTALKKVSI